MRIIGGVFLFLSICAFAHESVDARERLSLCGNHVASENPLVRGIRPINSSTKFFEFPQDILLYDGRTDAFPAPFNAPPEGSIVIVAHDQMGDEASLEIHLYIPREGSREIDVHSLLFEDGEFHIHQSVSLVMPKPGDQVAKEKRDAVMVAKERWAVAFQRFGVTDADLERAKSVVGPHTAEMSLRDHVNLLAGYAVIHTTRALSVSIEARAEYKLSNDEWREVLQTKRLDRTVDFDASIYKDYEFLSDATHAFYRLGLSSLIEERVQAFVK